MTQWLKQSTATVISFGPFVNPTDGVTLVTSLVSALDNGTTGIMLAKNGSAFAVRHATVTATTYDAYGNYLVTLDTTDTNTLGRLRMQFAAAASCVPVWMDFVVVAANIFDSFIGGGDVLDVSVIQLLGTAWLTPGTAGTPDVNTKLINGVATTSITTINANVGTTQPVNFTGTGAAALVKDDVVDIAGAAVSTSTAQLGVNAVNIGGTAQTGRDIGASVLLSSGTGTGQLDFTSGVVKANLAQILGTALTETAGLLAGAFKKFFNVATPTGTVNSIPDAVAGAAGGLAIVGSNMGTVSSVSGSVGSVAGNVTGSVGSIAAGGIAAASFAAGAIDAAAIANGAIDAATFAAGAIDATAIANAAIDAATFAAGAIDAAAIATGAIDADALASDAVAEIADGVWDELIAGHLGAGSTGAALNAAGSAGDPWTTLIPGAYGAGTAGHRLGNIPDAVAGAAGGVFIAGANAATTVNITGSITGNLSGSVGSVTGAVGSVTGAVGSVTGNVGGNVTGSVGSVAGNVGGNVVGSTASVSAAVTVGTNNDKTGYALSTAGNNAAADALLKRDWTLVGAPAARSALNALRFLRNLWVVTAGTLHVTEEDDTTDAWTAVLTTDATADPVIGSDPT